MPRGISGWGFDCSEATICLRYDQPLKKVRMLNSCCSSSWGPLASQKVQVGNLLHAVLLGFCIPPAARQSRLF